MGFRSGLFPGHSSTEILFFLRKSVVTLDRWQGAPSCMKIVHLWMSICSFSFSFSNFTYLGPFIVVLGGIKYRPEGPKHDMAPQITWLGGCFIVAAVYFSSNRLPTGRLTCLLRGINCCMVDSSESNTFFHCARVQWRSSQVSGVASGLTCAQIHRWDVSKQYLLSVKQPEFSCMSSLASASWCASLRERSFQWMTTPFTVTKSAISIEFDDGVVHGCLGIT